MPGERKDLPLVPRAILEGHSFPANSGGELRVVEIRGIVAYYNRTISKSLGYALHCRFFFFKSNDSQWRSICVFGGYIQVSLREFFGGFVLSKARNLSNIL